MRVPPLVVALRPHQWTKNLVLFAAPALSKHIFETEPLVRACAAFVVFCGLSGTIYLLNDVADAERDRLHPAKRHRPVASGALAPSHALTAAALLALACLAVSVLIGQAFAIAATAFLILNLAYSFALKEVVILDVLAIAMGFVIRAVAGGLAVGAPISDWLLICTLLLALFLALSKRRHELTSLSDAATDHRASLAEYSPYLLDQMVNVVTASCLTAYAFYTTSPETVAKYQTTRLVWTIPFVIYGIFRYLYLVHRKELGGSPSDVLLTDRPLLVTLALWIAALMTIVYSAPGAPMPLGGP